MTLPVALLIACYKHESISREIREIVGEKVTVMESLSCKCNNHVSRLHLVPPSSCCSSDRSSPASDVGSEFSSGISTNPIKSYSYFSDLNHVEKPLLGDYGEQLNVNLGRYLSALVDLVENVTVRFNHSYIFKEDEVIINYQKRDILDLGGNIQGLFPLRHPAQRQIQLHQQQHQQQSLGSTSVRRSCAMNDCDFQDLLPIN